VLITVVEARREHFQIQGVQQTVCGVRWG